MNQNLVVAVVVGEDGLDQFAQGIGRAGPPGGAPAWTENDVVAFSFGEGSEVRLELGRTLQRNVKVMAQLKGSQKRSVVLQLLGDVVNRLAMNRREQGQTHHSGLKREFDSRA